MIKDLDKIQTDDNNWLDKIFKYYEMLEKQLDPNNPEDDFPLEYFIESENPRQMTHDEARNLTNTIYSLINSKSYYTYPTDHIHFMRHADNRSIASLMSPLVNWDRKIYPAGIILNKEVDRVYDTITTPLVHEGIHYILRRILKPTKYDPIIGSDYRRLSEVNKDPVLANIDFLMRKVREVVDPSNNPEYAPTETAVEMMSQAMSKPYSAPTGTNTNRIIRAISDLSYTYHDALTPIKEALNYLYHGSGPISKELFNYFYDTSQKTGAERREFFQELQNNPSTEQRHLKKLLDYIFAIQRP